MNINESETESESESNFDSSENLSENLSENMSDEMDEDPVLNIRKKKFNTKQKDCYEVEKLLNIRQLNNRTQYLVQWSDSEEGEIFEPTWENEENISSNLIRNYHFTNQINQHNSLIGPNTNNAHLYLRVSDKAKTAKVMNRFQNNQPAQSSQSSQSYFTNFPEGNFSLDSQKEILMKYCVDNNYNIKSIKFDDGISARDVSKLTGLQELITEIKKGETLLFIDLTRFSRDSIGGIKILDNLHARDVRIYSVLDGMNYDTPVSRHCVRTAISGAQLESDLKSLKIRTSIKNIKNKGGFVGSKAPYGQKIVQDGHMRKLVPNPSHQHVLKIISRMLSTLTMPRHKIYDEIVNHLNENTDETYNGKNFTVSNIKYIISKCLKTSNFPSISSKVSNKLLSAKEKRNDLFIKNRRN
jgi:DNA invertase Pin-like site-specific DNA recombinase